MVRIRDILRHTATAIAVVAMLLWVFRVHVHAMWDDGDVRTAHSDQACGILGLADGEADPEPHDEDDHCACAGAACTPPLLISVLPCGAGSEARLRPERVHIPEGLAPQPDPPPVRTA